MAATVLPYELYSDSPGFLLNKPEWEAANSAHAQDTDFGDVPQGWPKKLSGPLVWSGEDLRAQPEKWVHVLNNSEISEIDNATKHFKSLSIPLSELARNHFPLPSLGQVLRNISHNIYHGTGINLLRGIPVEKYEKDELAIVCLGLNSWVGDQRLPQGIRRGLCHIKSIAHIERTKRGAIYVSAQNAAAQMYHSDAGADVVSLMAVSVPENSQGGESKIASAWRVYNHLAEHRPDILRLLGERRFRWRANGIPAEGVRLLHWFQDRLMLNFSTRTFIGFAEVPERDKSFEELTFEEREAFAGFNWVAEQYSVTTKLEKGDIEWVNNVALQHARTGYVDDPEHPRHLLRVWLRDSEHAVELPGDIRNKFDAMFGEPADFIPLDELVEDEARRNTGVFTASCKDETARQRLEQKTDEHGNLGV